MNQNVKLSTDVVQMNQSDIVLSTNEKTLSSGGSVKGASTDSLHSSALSGAIVLVIIFAIFIAIFIKIPAKFRIKN